MSCKWHDWNQETVPGEEDRPPFWGLNINAYKIKAKMLAFHNLYDYLGKTDRIITSYLNN